MSYLKDEDIIDIQNNVRLLSIKEIDDISHYSFDSNIEEYVRLFSVDEIEDISHYLFDSKIEEYNEFLNKAKLFSNLNISKTFVLIHRKTNELLAYMTLSADSIL